MRTIFKDLWQLPNDLQTANITTEIETNFYRRCPPEKRPAHLRAKLAREDEDEITPATDPEKQAKDKDSSSTKGHVKGKKKPVYDASLPKALHQTFFYTWWLAGLLKLLSGIFFPVLVLCKISILFRF